MATRIKCCECDNLDAALRRGDLRAIECGSINEAGALLI